MVGGGGGGGRSRRNREVVPLPASPNPSNMYICIYICIYIYINTYIQNLDCSLRISFSPLHWMNGIKNDVGVHRRASLLASKASSSSWKTCAFACLLNLAYSSCENNRLFSIVISSSLVSAFIDQLASKRNSPLPPLGAHAASANLLCFIDAIRTRDMITGRSLEFDQYE